MMYQLLLVNFHDDILQISEDIFQYLKKYLLLLNFNIVNIFVYLHKCTKF